MLRKLREARDEEGFTLIELLVVVIIIGILAAIAIPVFLNQRQKGFRAAAESDVRNSAIEVESYFTDDLAYPANQAAFDALDFELSDGVNLTYTLNTAQDAFCIVAEHDQLTDESPDATYQSDLGGLVKPAAACSLT